MLVPQDLCKNLRSSTKDLCRFSLMNVLSVTESTFLLVFAIAMPP